MELVFVEPTYTVAQRRTILTKALDETRRLDVITRPIDPKFSKTLEIDRINTVLVTVKPAELEEWGSAGQMVRNLAGYTKLPLEVWAVYSEEILHKLGNEFPDILDVAGQPFFCPIISEEGVGYREGFVIGWDEEDTLNVAAYMAGGYVEVFMELLDYGAYVNGGFLGNVSYANIDHGTEDYWNVVAGYNFLDAIETLAEVEILEPDPKFPGAELLRTFTKLKLN
jgi:hypothetical protein